MISVKNEAKKIIDDMPEETTWDDIMYKFYVRQKIEKGLKDVDNGKTISFDEAKNRLIEK